jgi:hypothetical protein
MARLAINNDLLAEEYFEDAQLIGIQCALPPQKLVWLINAHCQYEFKYYPANDITLTKKGRKLHYAVFMCQEGRFVLQHIIYTNQQQGEYLLPELKHFDFIWMMKTERNIESLVAHLTEELKTIDRVQLALEIDCAKILHKKHLVL